MQSFWLLIAVIAAVTICFVTWVIVGGRVEVGDDDD